MRLVAEESTLPLGVEGTSGTDRIITADELLDISARGHNR